MLEVGPEFDAYLHALPHVSASCRLSAEEEHYAMRMCKHATARILNLLNLRTELVGAKDRRAGGAPLGRLFLKTPRMKPLRYVQYASPGAMLDADKVFDLVWKDELMGDEEEAQTVSWDFSFSTSCCAVRFARQCPSRTARVRLACSSLAASTSKRAAGDARPWKRRGAGSCLVCLCHSCSSFQWYKRWMAGCAKGLPERLAEGFSLVSNVRTAGGRVRGFRRSEEDQMLHYFFEFLSASPKNSFPWHRTATESKVPRKQDQDQRQEDGARPIRVSDYACSQRQLSSSILHEMPEMASQPLLAFERFLTSKVSPPPGKELPFEDRLAAHPVAATELAQNTIERMRTDLDYFSTLNTVQKMPRLEDILELQKELLRTAMQDEKQAIALFSSCMSSMQEKEKSTLKVIAGKKAMPKLHHRMAALMSSQEEEWAPSSPARTEQLERAMLLVSARGRHALAASMCPGAKTDEKVRLKLGKLLTASRHIISKEGSTTRDSWCLNSSLSLCCGAGRWRSCDNLPLRWEAEGPACSR